MNGRANPPPDFRPGEDYAREMDAWDPLAAFRSRFHLPRGADWNPPIYFTGNSLGRQPRSAMALAD